MLLERGQELLGEQGIALRRFDDAFEHLRRRNPASAFGDQLGDIGYLEGLEGQGAVVPCRSGLDEFGASQAEQEDRAAGSLGDVLQQIEEG